MRNAESEGAARLREPIRPGWMRLALPLPALACAAAAMPLGLTVQPSQGDAKAPGVSHCYRSVCHRVRTVEQTRRLIGRPFTVETSYYDMPGIDRFNTGTYTSNGERFDANDSARVASSDLPDGTELLLRNPVNGRVSHVRVNDFGPFRGDRRLDVTRRVAEDLDFKHKGVVRLEVIVIAPPAAEDLTYRRNRERRATRGHLGVVFEPEMPALVSGLVAERNTAPESGPVIAVTETPVLQTASLEMAEPVTAAVAVLAAPATTISTDTMEYEWLAGAGIVEAEPEAPASQLSAITVAALSDEAEAKPAPIAAAEPAPPAAKTTAEPAAIPPPVQTALALSSQLASAHSVPEDTIDETAADPMASDASRPETHRPDAYRTETGSFARAAVATSDFGGGLSPHSTSRNLFLVILAGLLTATLAASLSAGHRMSRRNAPARPPGIGGNSWFARSRGDQRTPLGSAGAPALARTMPETAGVTVRVTQPAIPEAVRAASFIAADFAIEGHLRSSGRIEIAGQIKGRIETDELVVLAGGVVEGDVICRHVTVYGTINGVISTHELQVHEAGHVDAAIETSVITVAPGARFEGQVRRRQLG